MTEREVLQEIMQVLGPDVPTNVDYTIPGNAEGLIDEQRQALRLLRAAGIEYLFTERGCDDCARDTRVGDRRRFNSGNALARGRTERGTS